MIFVGNLGIETIATSSLLIRIVRNNSLTAPQIMLSRVKITRSQDFTA